MNETFTLNGIKVYRQYTMNGAPVAIDDEGNDGLTMEELRYIHKAARELKNSSSLGSIYNEDLCIMVTV